MTEKADLDLSPGIPGQVVLLYLRVEQINSLTRRCEMSRYWFALIAALILLSCSNSMDSDLDYAVYNNTPRAHSLLDTEDPDMAIDMLEYAYEHL
ncbi:MAG: hypothetical protein PVF95_14110, partial [bacterium]